MAAQHASYSSLSSLFQGLRLSPTLTTLRHNALQPLVSMRSFTSSPAVLARGSKGKKKRDMRITMIRYHLMHGKTPRPLRLSRMRSLRHWTIHRAWLLFRRKLAEAQEMELYRMYQSMFDACEALRNLDPPGTKNAGRLYRIAMEKKGVYRPGGIPIEYGRHQTETPGTRPWDHAWTR